MGTTIPYNLTDIGEGIAEVEVIEWFVSEVRIFYFEFTLTSLQCIRNSY